MKTWIRHIVAAALLVGPATTAAQEANWFEIAGSYYSPDWEFRETETGIRASGQVWHGRWYGRATYNTIDTKRVDLPVVRLRGLPFGDWREIIVGHSFGTSSGSSVQLEAAYQAIKVFNSTESGYSLSAALAHRFGPRVSTSLRLGYLELEEQDWRITGELLVMAGKSSAVVARIDDFAEFDFTWYELGVRFYF